MDWSKTVANENGAGGSRNEETQMEVSHIEGKTEEKAVAFDDFDFFEEEYDAKDILVTFEPQV